MKQMENIRDLSKRISEKLEKESTPESFKLELKDIPVKDFLIYNFINYPESYIRYKLLFSYIEYWETLTLDDWKEVIIGISKDELALYTCLSFLYRTLRINSIKLYKEMEAIDASIKANVLKYFEERPGVLGEIEKYYNLELQSFGLNQSSFDHVHNRLIKEGALPAPKITPKIIRFD